MRRSFFGGHEQEGLARRVTNLTFHPEDRKLIKGAKNGVLKNVQTA